MAEEIEIVNVGGDGGVASEATLAMLVQSIERMSRSSGADPKETKKVTEQLHGRMKNLIKTYDETDDAVEDLGDSASRASTALGYVGSAFKLLTSGIFSVVGSVSNFAEELMGSSTELSDFARHVPFVGDQLEFFAGILDNSIRTYRELANVGATFSNSITEMRLAATEAEIPLATFAQLVINNSENLRQLGGTVSQGAARFSNLSAQLKDTGYFEQLKTLGFTTEDIYEGLVDYNNLQRRLGRSQVMTDEQLIEGTGRYLAQVDRLTRATGLQREEIERSMAEVAMDAAARSLLNQFEEGSQEFTNLEANLNLINTQLSGATKIAFQDLLDGFINAEETGPLLAALGDDATYVREALAAVGQGADPNVLRGAFAAAGGALEEFANGDARVRSSIIQSLRRTQPILADFLDNSTALLRASDANLDAADAEQDASDGTTGALVQFEDRINEVRTALEQTFIESGLFDTLANGFASVIDAMASPEMQERIRSGMAYLTNFLEAFATDPLKAMQDFFADLTDAFLDFFLGPNTKTIMQPGMGEVEVPIERQGGFWQTTLRPIVNDMFDYLKQSMLDGISYLWENTYIIEGMIAGILALWAAPGVVAALAGAITSNMLGGGKGRGGAGWIASLLGFATKNAGPLAAVTAAVTPTTLADGTITPEIEAALAEQAAIEAAGGPSTAELMARDYLEGLSLQMAEEVSRIERSLAGENEYWGRETKGREESRERILELTNTFNDYIASVADQYDLSDLTPPEIPEFNRGTGGFQNFGRGTLAMLHGMEAVIPMDSPIGRILANLDTSDLGSVGTASQPSSVEQMITQLNSANDRANEYLNSINTANQGSSEALKELNTTMQRTNVLLATIKSVEDKIERNTASSNNDISSGRITRMR